MITTINRRSTGDKRARMTVETRLVYHEYNDREYNDRDSIDRTTR
jgi:hypothetical protein